MSSAIAPSLRDLHPRDLKDLVKEIPTLPVIYQQLFRMIQDPDVSVPQLAELISRDQALSAKILHLVNSAFYGQHQQIKTISRAVVVLGFQSVRSAALATSVFDYFKDEDSSGRCDLGKFWEHSIAVACVCKILAGNLNIQQAEEAFVVGLLHDIGKLVMKKYFPADFDDLVEHLHTHQDSWHEAERALFQTDHTVIGKVIFRAWRFPPTVVEAIHLHHAPNAGPSYPQLVSLVHLADFISYQLGLGSPLSQPPEGWDPAALEILGVDENSALAEREELEREIDQAMAILKLLE